LDGDGDGYGEGSGCLGVDCDDGDAAANPGAEEICDGADDDCDERIDEEIEEISCGEGACAMTVPGCADGVPGECTPGTPSPRDLCNGIDDDCDGRTDEGINDHFDDPMLRPAWVNPARGSEISFAIADSFFRVEDAPFASTPSNPAASWIYEPDVDLGNQIALARSIGGSDFELFADIDWSSTGPELTLAGVALTNLDGQLELMLGYGDGSSANTGSVRVRARLEGDDASWSAPSAMTGTASFRAIREAGVLTVYVDDVEVLSTPFTADIHRVAIYAVAHRNSSTTYPFGSFGLDRVQVCH
jgi:hypothetical protein